jgi:hypothetical protein
VVTRGLLLAVFAVVLVTLARSDVLRSREVYADRTAVRWGADPRSWAVTASSQAGGAVRRVVGSFAELWRTHPRWDLRRESLGDPLMLFGLRALPMFLTGAAAAVINFHLASELTPYGLHGSWVGLTGELAAAMLVTGVAGIILWRAVGHAALTGRRVPSGVVAGLWLGIGMAVGELVNDQGAVFQWLPDHPEALLLVVFAAVVFALWVAQCARLWIRTWPGRSIHSPMLVALAAAGLALASWFAWWRSDGLLLTSGLPVSPSMVRDALAQQAIVVPAGQSGTLTVIAVVFPVMAGLLEPPLVLATAVALWLIPLLAWTTRVPQTTGWAPTTVPGAAGGPGEAVPSLRRVLLPGLLGGVLCWTAVAGVQVYLHPLRPHDRREAGGFALIYVGWLLVAVVGATAVAALAASVLAGRYRLLVALIAGGTATVTGLAGAFVLASVDGCVRPLSILQSSCGWRPAGTWPYFGLLLAPSLVVGALVAVVGTAVGLVFGARLSRHASREIRLTTRRVTVAALGLAAVGVVAAAVLSGVRNSTGAGVGARALFRPAADVPVSDRTRATQVIAWFKFGGDDLESRIVDAEQRLAATLSKLANSPTDDIDASPLLPICADIGSIARNAAGYFRIPDPEAQQHWQVFITQAEQGSRDCEKAVGSNQGDLFERALTELTEAATAGSVASERINAVMAPG